MLNKLLKCTYIHIHTYVHTYTYVCTYIYIRTYIHIRTYVRTYIYIRTYVHTYVYVLCCLTIVSSLLYVIAPPVAFTPADAPSVSVNGTSTPTPAILAPLTLSLVSALGAVFLAVVVLVGGMVILVPVVIVQRRKIRAKNSNRITLSVPE